MWGVDQLLILDIGHHFPLTKGQSLVQMDLFGPKNPYKISILWGGVNKYG